MFILEISRNEWMAICHYVSSPAHRQWMCGRNQLSLKKKKNFTSTLLFHLIFDSYARILLEGSLFLSQYSQIEFSSNMLWLHSHKSQSLWPSGCFLYLFVCLFNSYVAHVLGTWNPNTSSNFETNNLIITNLIIMIDFLWISLLE